MIKQLETMMPTCQVLGKKIRATATNDDKWVIGHGGTRLFRAVAEATWDIIWLNVPEMASSVENARSLTPNFYRIGNGVDCHDGSGSVVID